MTNNRFRFPNRIRPMTEAQGIHFWSLRPFRLVGSFPTHTLNQQRRTNETERTDRQTAKMVQFFTTHSLQQRTGPSAYTFTDIARDLTFWARFQSWTYCETCKLLNKQTLLPSYSNRKQTNTNCICTKNRYVVPRHHDIHASICDLTREEILALRPLTLHTGNHVVLQHGYRQKDGFCRASWSQLSVQEKIALLPTGASRLRCQLAHRFLMTSQHSRYSHFVNLRETQMTDGARINIYDFHENDGVECALWPHLYPLHTWCETSLSGNTSRLSGKVSFVTKLLSEILDYSLDYELLQFVYDRWLFTTVSGAISACSLTRRSPATSLDSKTFSPEYWKWQHRFLLDALRQYGYPSLFITLSPFEWTFPTPEWLTQASQLSGKGPTQLACLETIHIVHLLEQTVRGYICGTNTNRWVRHLLNYNNTRTQTNVTNFFYRLEFQGRGTTHVHLLVWLKDISYMQYRLIRADVPWDDRDLAFLVCDLQPSHKDAMPLQPLPTHVAVAQHGNGKKLRVRHPADAFAMNSRAYIASLIPFLKCRMDVQTTDHRSMILRYVTSYVSKFKDARSNDSLYSRHVTPAMAAYRHLADMKPLEPEMIVTLTSAKLAWSNNSTKRYIPPRPINAAESAMVTKYLARPVDAHSLTLLEFLRQYDTAKSTPKPYKRGVALVGVKYVSVFNPVFFFQHLLLNVTFTSLEDIVHPDHERLPEDLKHFAAALAHQRGVWDDDNTVATCFVERAIRSTTCST